MDSRRALIEAATALAESLPSDTVDALATAILLRGTSSRLQAEVAKRIPHHDHRARALKFVTQWKQEASELDSSTVSAALQTAAASERRHRDAQSVELVWTGPDCDTPLRRTEQAILQLLDSAQERITLVSFAVYAIPNIATALVRAAQRGVKITVIVETPDRMGGENEYNTLRALGKDVEACSTVYFWPRENRQLSHSNKPGLLHVKCAVADGEWLFISSANLTQQAFTINMELGMLVRGGTMAGRVEEQFRELILRQTLVRVDAQH